MKYFASLVFFYGLFFMATLVMAEDARSLGVVRILKMRPPIYNPKTRTIVPDSQNIVFSIKDIQLDTKTSDRVWLLAEKGGKYGALLVRFDSVAFDNNIPQKFSEFLKNTPGFQINLDKESLVYKNIGLDAYAEVSAKNIKIYSEEQKEFVSLKASICPITQETEHWWSVGKPRAVREDCL